MRKLDRYGKTIKLSLLLLALSVPIFFSLQVWGVFRYKCLKKELMKMEAEQESLLEKNKKVIANIALFKSPDRIERLARENLGLEFIDSPERIIKIEFSSEKGKVF